MYRLIALEQMGNLHGLSVELITPFTSSLLLGLCQDMLPTNRHLITWNLFSFICCYLESYGHFKMKRTMIQA